MDTAFVAFFLAEMGDKTQFATIALAARFDQLGLIILGTTLDMMFGNIPASGSAKSRRRKSR